MAGPAQASVNIDTKQFEQELAKFINQNAETIARQIAIDAKTTTAFKDKTGTLRKSIRARKSKFEDGGWIVVAGSPHAHLVEYGHKNAPAHPFLRPALDKNIAEAKRLFGAK